MNKGFGNDMKVIGKGLLEINRICPGYILCICLYALFQSVQPFIGLFFSARIIDAILAKAELGDILCLAAIMVGTDCACTIIMKAMDGVVICKADFFSTTIKSKITEKMFRIDYEKVEDPEYHQKREKIESVEQMMGMGLYSIGNYLPRLLKYAVTIILALSLTVRLFFTFEKGGNSWHAFVCSPISSVLLAALIIASVYANMRIVSRAENKAYQLLEGLEEKKNVLSYYLNEYIGNYRIGKDIRIYHQNPMLMQEMEEEYRKYRIIYGNIAKTQSHYRNLASLLSLLVSAMIYLFVGMRAMAGLFGVGSIVQYVGSINQFVSGVTYFVAEFTHLRASSEAVGYYFDYMEIPDSVMDEGLEVEGEVRDIEFHNVSFKYPGTDVYVLQNVSLKIQGGSKLAIVGMNGSGKTTLIKLLCRLYQPTEGYITLNGTDIREYQYGEYLNLISVVFQDFKLFAYPLGENIAASNQVDEKKVEEALCRAGLGERYHQMEDGIKTFLYKDYDESGVEISGGEAQKIAIARALYKDVPIVILDEPTAALDPISEFEIYSSFNQMVENKMALFISHRLSSCRFCDQIAVMDAGMLVQLGNHETLAADVDGKYYELWNAQAQYYTKEKETYEQENEFIPAGMADICQ